MSPLHGVPGWEACVVRAGRMENGVVHFLGQMHRHLSIDGLSDRADEVSKTQLELLRMLESMEVKHVFAEGATSDRAPGEIDRNGREARLVADAFPGGAVGSDAATDLQLKLLYELGAEKIYQHLHADVHLHATNTEERERALAREIPSLEREGESAEELVYTIREQYALEHVAAFLASLSSETRAGTEVALIYGAAHSFKDAELPGATDRAPVPPSDEPLSSEAEGMPLVIRYYRPDYTLHVDPGEDIHRLMDRARLFGPARGSANLRSVIQESVYACLGRDNSEQYDDPLVQEVLKKVAKESGIDQGLLEERSGEPFREQYERIGKAIAELQRKLSPADLHAAFVDKADELIAGACTVKAMAVPRLEAEQLRAALPKIKFEPWEYSPEEALKLVSDRISKLPGGPERTALESEVEERYLAERPPFSGLKATKSYSLEELTLTKVRDVMDREPSRANLREILRAAPELPIEIVTDWVPLAREQKLALLPKLAVTPEQRSKFEDPNQLASVLRTWTESDPDARKIIARMKEEGKGPFAVGSPASP